jgi:hypothetical protein
MSDNQYFYEVVGASTKDVYLEGTKCRLKVIAELVDKQTRKKVVVEKLIRDFNPTIANIETYMCPTSFQTTPNDNGIVRLDDFTVFQKDTNGDFVDIGTFSRNNVIVVCDRSMAQREEWAK